MRICFVCLGNICRSPAAAAVFADLAAADGVDVTVDSAGTSRYHLGEAPARAHAGRGAAAGHRRSTTAARQFTAADFDRFDLVVAMDAANRRDLLRLAPDDAARAKVVHAAAFAGDRTSTCPTRGACRRPPTPRCSTSSTRPAPASSSTRRDVIGAAGRAGRRARRHRRDARSAAATSPRPTGSTRRADRCSPRPIPTRCPGCSSGRPPVCGRCARPAPSPCPRSCGSAPAGLVLEWIDVGGRTAASEADLGRRLAALHRVTGPHFGGLDDAPRRLPRLAARRPHADRRLGRRSSSSGGCAR